MQQLLLLLVKLLLLLLLTVWGCDRAARTCWSHCFQWGFQSPLQSPPLLPVGPQLLLLLLLLLFLNHPKKSAATSPRQLNPDHQRPRGRAWRFC